MRIVQALGWYFPESLGGTEIYVAGLSRRLRAAGHEVFVVAPDSAHDCERTYEHEGVPVYRYPIPDKPTRAECQATRPVRGVECLDRWLEKTRPDVVHIHSFVTGLGVQQVKKAESLGARVIATNHLASLGFICQRGTLMRWGERLCDGICRPIKCAACDLQQRGLPKPLSWAIAAIPPSIGRFARAVPGKTGTALSMSDLIARNQKMQREMMNSIDSLVVLNQWALEAIAANGAPPDKLVLNRLGLSHEEIIRKPGPDDQPAAPPIKIGYVGRLAAIKGVHDLARAVASLPRELPIRVEFRGPTDSSESRAVVEELRAIINDDPRVEFAAPVCASEIPQVMAGYDVLCCPSVCFESGPTVASEAHAVGTPVIGARIGGLAEMITDKVNGRLVEPGDWRALARVLREVASDPAGTIDRWRRSLPVARTMDDIAAEYLNLYQAK